MTFGPPPDPDVHEARDPLQIAVDLTAAVDGLSAAIAAERRRTRRRITGIIATLIVDGILTGWIAVATHDAHRAASTAAADASELRISCEATNAGREATVQLWDYILSVPPATPQTPAEAAQVAQFRAYLGTEFAQRVCPAG